MIKKIIIGSIILVSVLIAYKLVIQIMEAVKSGERLSQSADVVYKLEIKNKELKKQLSQIQSMDFIEEEIRNKLGFAKKGETIVVIPEDKLRLVLGTSASAQERFSNWLGWLKVFFR